MMPGLFEESDGDCREKWAAFSRCIQALHEREEDAPFDYAGLREMARSPVVQLAGMPGRVGV